MNSLDPSSLQVWNVYVPSFLTSTLPVHFATKRSWNCRLNSFSDCLILHRGDRSDFRIPSVKVALPPASLDPRVDKYFTVFRQPMNCGRPRGKFSFPISRVRSSAAAPSRPVVFVTDAHVSIFLQHKLEGLIPLTTVNICCLLYTSPSPRDQRGSRMPSSA